MGGDKSAGYGLVCVCVCFLVIFEQEEHCLPYKIASKDGIGKRFDNYTFFYSSCVHK